MGAHFDSLWARGICSGRVRRVRGSHNQLCEAFVDRPWLLKFTWIPWGAEYVKYEVPDLSAAPAFGSIGLEDANRWPRLPLGTMTAGDPVSEERSVFEANMRKTIVQNPGPIYEALECLDEHPDIVKRFRALMSRATKD